MPIYYAFTGPGTKQTQPRRRPGTPLIWRPEAPALVTDRTRRGRGGSQHGPSSACSPLNTAGSEKRFPATPSPFATNLPVQMTTSPLDQQQFQRTLIA
jgi:hypothetical protein